jgi:hypothetical protein
LVKGYEFDKDRYVLLDDEDFEQARIDRPSVLTINKSVASASMGPILFDTSYYAAPGGETAGKTSSSASRRDPQVRHRGPGRVWQSQGGSAQWRSCHPTMASCAIRFTIHAVFVMSNRYGKILPIISQIHQ